MRAAAFFVDLTKFWYKKPRTSHHTGKGLGGTIGRGKYSSRKRDGKRSKSAPGMVFRAIIEFIRRIICHLIGLLRLGYRKVQVLPAGLFVLGNIYYYFPLYYVLSHVSDIAL